MANQPIPTLPVAISLSGDEQFELVQPGGSTGTTKRGTISQIGTYISTTYPPAVITSVGTASPLRVDGVAGGTIDAASPTGTISIAPNGITNNLLAQMAGYTIKANTSGSTATPVDATVSQVLDTVSSTQGSVLYRGASTWQALTPGTNGYVLATAGASSNPFWKNVSAFDPTNVAITGGTIDGTVIGGVDPRAGTFTSLTASSITFSSPATISNATWNGSTIAIAYGGTGATTASGARANLGAASSGANSDITSLSGLSTPLSSPQGGTGFSSYTTGDLLYADTSSTLARLNDVSTGNALISGGIGVAPSWGKIGLTTHVSGTLPVANGGTGATTLTGYVKGNGTSAFTASSTIPNADLQNSSVTIGSTSIALGGTSTTLAGLTTITLTQDPSASLQAATKQYVDNTVATVANLTYHAAAGYATTADLGSVTYNNGSSGVGATLTNAGTQAALVIDGYTFLSSDVTNATRVLVKNESNAAYNGVYTVTNQGSVSTNWVLTRATDFNATGTGPNYIETGAAVFISSGTLNGSTSWVLITTGTITVGSTSLTFAQNSASGSITVSSPLQKTGNNISLDTVTVPFGGTGLTTLTQYAVILGNGSGNVNFASPGTTGYPLLSNGASSNPSFGQLSLTAGVTGILPVGNGGTGTNTTFTAGSVVFAGASGIYSQNNTKLFWDNTNFRLGVNTGSPNTTVSIVSNTQTATPPTSNLPAGTDLYILGANASNTRITQDAYGNGNYSAYTGRQARGTAASPTASQTDDILVEVTGRGYGATAFGSQSVVRIDMVAAENFTDTAQGTYMSLYTTATGATSPAERFRVGPSGQLGIGGATYGTSGYVLTSGGSSAAPTWSQVSLTAGVTGTLPVTNGGTGLATVAQGDLLYGSASNTLSALAKNITATRYLANTGTNNNPQWDQVNLANGVTGQLPLANGGTNANLTASNGGIFYSTASAAAILSGTATANQVLLSGASGAPSWSTATYPATTTINQILYSSAANTVTGLATANNSILVTGATGIPSLSTTLPAHTVTTSVTVPLVIGGTGTTGTQLTLQTTTGIGTTDAFAFKGGNNGATTFATLAAAGLAVTSSGANALAVGPSGTTNPSLNVDASTASAATGLNIKSAAAAGGLAVSVISSGSNENLTIDAKGTGTITVGGTSTGAITLTRATTMSNALTYGGVTLSNSVTGTGSMVLSASPTFTGTLSSANQTITSASANALAVGPNGTTGPAFNVDASTASSITGLNVKSAASGGGLAVSVVSNGSTNENLTIDAKGSGTVTINGTATGGITLNRAVTLSSTINKVTITAPATGSTLTIADGKTLTASNTLTFAGTDGQTFTFPASTSNVLTTGNTATITKGYSLTPYNIGSFTSVTSTTLDPANGNYQYVSLSGTFTWTVTAPTNDCAIDVLVILGASGSGATIAYSGFKTPGSGAAGTFTAANNTWYVLSVRKTNGVAIYNWSGSWT